MALENTAVLTLSMVMENTAVLTLSISLKLDLLVHGFRNQNILLYYHGLDKATEISCSCF